MDHQEAFDLLAGNIDFGWDKRAKLAETMREEIDRLRGIIDRNRASFEKMRTRAETAERDRDIYRSRADKAEAELRILKLGGGNPFGRLF